MSSSSPATASEWFWLADAPAELSVGRVALRPLDALSLKLLTTRCSVCGGHSTNALVADCGHDFCAHCALLINQDQQTVWCTVCNRQAEAMRTDLSRFLAKMRFQCSCAGSFEGGLADIRAHILAGQHHSMDDASAGDQDTAAGSTEATENETNALCERMQAMETRLEELREVGIANSASLQELKARSAGIRKHYFSIPVKKLIDEHNENNGKIVISKWYTWTGVGFPCASKVQIAKIDGESWLGVYHTTHDASPAQSPWPMKCSIRVEFLDQNGNALTSFTTLTFRDGRPTSKKFAEPQALSNALGRGPQKVMLVKDLLDPVKKALTEGGFVSMSLEATPL